MRFLTTVAASALLATTLFSAAFAAPIAGQTGVTQVSGHLMPVEKTQFFFGGYNYCWYPVGWHGPGYYWCGYAWRRGFGWGGGRGWHGGHGGWHGGHGGGHGGHGGHHH